MSTGPAGGNGASIAFYALFRGASADGSRVFFETVESLVSGDTDESGDVYERSGDQTMLVSTGPRDTGANGEFAGASADGSRVFFFTSWPLVSADSDGETDIYERSGNVTTLVSIGPRGGNGRFYAFFRGVSADGSRVFFWTEESLVSGDTDTVGDVYVKRTAEQENAPAGQPPAGGGVTPAAPPPPPAAVPPGQTTPARGRGRLTARVTPASDLRPAFTASGRLTLPRGVSQAVGCRGQVSVQVKRAGTTISTRRVFLRRNCTFSLRVSFANSRRFGTPRSLRFTARFLGNARVAPATAPARFARIRR